jgi:hypothetical protein
VSGLEAAGMMRRMSARLADEPTRAEYERAHRDYLARRDAAAAAAGLEPLPEGMQSAGGMPDRVKCLHALVAHELAAPGANVFGREAVEAAGQWWSRGRCVLVHEEIAPEEMLPADTLPADRVPEETVPADTVPEEAK